MLPYLERVQSKQVYHVSLSCLRCSLVSAISYLRRPDRLSCADEVRADVDRRIQSSNFVNAKQGYQINLPLGWKTTQKAGADALFEEPSRTSTNVGVTVAPVRVPSLEAFGDLTSVSDKLLAAERKKVRLLTALLPSWLRSTIVAMFAFCAPAHW